MRLKILEFAEEKGIERGKETAREEDAQITRLLLQQKSAREIAESLRIPQQNVDSFLKKVMS